MRCWGEAEDSRWVDRSWGEIPAVETEVAAAGGEYEVNMAVKNEFQRARVVLWDKSDFTIVLYALNYHVDPGGSCLHQSEHASENLSFHNQFRRVLEGLVFPMGEGVNEHQFGVMEDVVPCHAPLGDKLPQGLAFCNRNACVASFNGRNPDWNGLPVGGLNDHLPRRYHITTRSAHAERHSAKNLIRHRVLRLEN